MLTEAAAPSAKKSSVLDGPAVHPQPCLEVRVRNGQIEVAKAAAARSAGAPMPDVVQTPVPADPTREGSAQKV